MVKQILLKLDNELFNKLSAEKGKLSWEEFLLEKQNKDWELIHTNIHAVRMIKGYKPTDFERKVGAIIVEKFKDVCPECKEASERLKKQTTELKKNSFWDGIFNG